MSAAHEYPDERSFHAAWHAACARSGGRVNETELALRGGALADRLAWIFISGYQAAVRRCFPEFATTPGWSCLAAAEAGDGAACHLEKSGEGLRLSGQKSWIAGAGVLDSLVVSVGADTGMCFVTVPADAAGVRISLPRTPGFLGELTQGVADFDGVLIPDDRMLRAPERRLEFRGAEPLYVLLALNACLKARAAEVGVPEIAVLADTAIHHGRTLPEVLGEKAAILPGLDRLRALSRETLDAAQAVVEQVPSLAASWQRDGRLFAMFGLETREKDA